MLSVVLRLLWRPAKEWIGKLPLFVAIAIWVVLAAALLTVLVKWWGGWPTTSPASGAGVGGATKAGAGTNQNNGAFEAVKSALTAVAGIGGVAYLVIKYRTEQRETAGIADKKISAAVDQLGSDKASTRIAGVYALTDIADRYKGQYRQRVVDILCGYLRSDRANYALDELGQPIKNASGHLVKSGASDEAVESTILSVMRDRLRKERKDDETGETIVQTVDDDQLWCACTFDLHEATFHEAVDLTDSTFECVPNFRGTKFERDADFGGATFAGDADFRGAHFAGDAHFDGATFTGDADFRGAHFTRDAHFDGAHFKGYAYFGWTPLTRYADAHFDGATFKGDAHFDGARFTGGAYFRGATFKGYAYFGGAHFAGWVTFGWATFAGGADFGGATFACGAYFGWAEFRASAAFLGIQGQPSFGFEECKFNRKLRGTDAYKWGPIPIPEDNDGLPAGAAWEDFQEEDDKDCGTTNR